MPRADGDFGRAGPSEEPLPARARLAAAARSARSVRVAMAAPRGASAAVRKRPFTIQGCPFDPPVTGLYDAASPFGGARASSLAYFMIGIEELRKPQLPFAAGSHSASAVPALPRRS